MENRVIDIIKTVFEVDFKEKNIDFYIPENMGDWDSLNVMELVIVLEEEFNVSLDHEDIEKIMEGGTSILEVLSSKQKND